MCSLCACVCLPLYNTDGKRDGRKRASSMGLLQWWVMFNMLVLHNSSSSEVMDLDLIAMDSRVDGPRLGVGGTTRTGVDRFSSNTNAYTLSHYVSGFHGCSSR